MTDVLRYSAFTRDPAAGNPAGVVLDGTGLSEPAMLAIAAEVGYSETAFLEPEAAGVFRARYFSPEIEVPFCGHATVATAVALAERDGPGTVLFRTQAGEVPVTTALDADGCLTATLTSVPTSVAEAGDVSATLAALGWSVADLDPELPVRVAYAGAHHLVLAVRSRALLAALDYDFDRLRELCATHGWVTVSLVWRESELEFHVRNPFPAGGVVEDPATGAAAAALGGYLRELGLVKPPAVLRIQQGADMGRPSYLTVEIPADSPSVRVTGNAVAIA